MKIGRASQAAGKVSMRSGRGFQLAQTMVERCPNRLPCCFEGCRHCHGPEWSNETACRCSRGRQLFQAHRPTALAASDRPCDRDHLANRTQSSPAGGPQNPRPRSREGVPSDQPSQDLGHGRLAQHHHRTPRRHQKRWSSIPVPCVGRQPIAIIGRRKTAKK